MEKIIINIKGNEVKLFSITIYNNDSDPKDGVTTIVFNTDGTFNVASTGAVSVLSTKFEKVIKCASEIYSAKKNTPNSEDYTELLKNNLKYKLADAVAEYAGHRYIIITGIETDNLFVLGNLDYCKYAVYKNPINNHEKKMYDMMLVKDNRTLPSSKTFISVYTDGRVCITSNGTSADLPLMGMDQFIGDKEFLDMSPEDKVEYIKKFGKLLSKRFDVVLED